MKDLWTYDSANRALVDENGLRVASEVGPQDARLILSARVGLVMLSEPPPGTDLPDDAGAHAMATLAAEVAKTALDGGYAPDPLDAHA